MNNISRKGFPGLGGAFLAGCSTLVSGIYTHRSALKGGEMLKIQEVG